MALPRRTMSAKGAIVKSRGFEALLNSFDKLMQNAVRVGVWGRPLPPCARRRPPAPHLPLRCARADFSSRPRRQVREMAFDIAELSVRKETLEARLAADELRRPDDPPPQILVTLLEEIGERMRRLVQFAGPVGADLVVAAIHDPLTRGALGLGYIEDEDAVRENAGNEDAARVWRRRLDARHVQPVRGVRGEAAYASHDDPTHTGERALHNVLNTLNPVDAMSYYQKQQLKYGRGRRGSTSVAGAWEALLGPGVHDRRPAPAHADDGVFTGGNTRHTQDTRAMHAWVPAALSASDAAWAARAAGSTHARGIAAAAASGEAGDVYGTRDPGVVSPRRQAEFGIAGVPR